MLTETLIKRGAGRLRERRVNKSVTCAGLADMKADEQVNGRHGTTAHLKAIRVNCRQQINNATQ